MMCFGEDRPRRRPSLTPMIDVVFLLLVFFMLASRFGQETVLELAIAGGPGAAWQGPPRLVEVGAETAQGAASGTASGMVALNGVPVALADLPAALAPLMQAPTDPVVVRARKGAVQDLVSVLAGLRAAGLGNLVLVE